MHAPPRPSGRCSSAVSLAAVVLLSAGDERREVRGALRSLDDYELPPTCGSRRCCARSGTGCWPPTVGQLPGLLGRFTPAGYRAQVREKLVARR